MRLRACAIEELACFTPERFASAGRTFPVGFHRGWRCLPAAMRADRASGTPVAASTKTHPLARMDLLEAAETVALMPA